MPRMVSSETESKLVQLQHVLFDEKIPVMVLFESPGGEIAGKIINNFISLLEPRGVAYHHLDHTYDVRYNRMTHFFSNIPSKGKICIYDRAWYSMLIESNPDEKTLEPSIEKLNYLERYLMNNGVLVVKIYLSMDSAVYEQYHDEYVGDIRCSALVDSFVDTDPSDVSLRDKIFKKSSKLVKWNIIDVGEPKKTMESVICCFIDSITELIRAPYKPSILAKDQPDYPNPRESMDLSATIDDKEYKKRLRELQSELANLQCRLATSDKSLVIAFEGWDAAGKGGAIKRITESLNPRGYRTVPVAAPTAEEKSKTHLWRFASKLPNRGRIVIFDRTWYGRMMVEPIEGFCTKEEYERSGVEINGFENFMTSNGTVLIKFWVEISKDEQLLRFNERRLDPMKRWKITDEDWRNREKWDVYEKYVNVMMERTNTPYAPWIVVESNDKKYARIKVLETIVNRLKEELRGSEKKRKPRALCVVCLRRLPIFVFDTYKYRQELARNVSDALREKIAGEIVVSSEPGRTIRKWREEFGVSQQALADEMGVAHSVISDYESGRRRSPGISLVRNIIDSLVRIDRARGSPTISKYSPEDTDDCIIAMDEFPAGVDVGRFVSAICGTNLTEGRIPERRIRGYTIVDSLKAIVSLSSNDYTKLYGWSTERALIFTNVHYGRSPMVAVRAHPLTPAAVVYIQPDNTDPLAIRLAQLEGIPLITTRLCTERVKSELDELKEML